MSLDALMDNLASLERLTPTQTGMYAEGTPQYTPDGSADQVPCSIQPASASTRLQYMQRQMRVTHTLYFDRDWNPQPRDRWVCYDSSGRTRYFVISGWYESLEINDTWTCDAEEQKPKLPRTPVP